MVRVIGKKVPPKYKGRNELYRFLINRISPDERARIKRILEVGVKEDSTKLTRQGLQGTFMLIL